MSNRIFQPSNLCCPHFAPSGVQILHLCGYENVKLSSVLSQGSESHAPKQKSKDSDEKLFTVVVPGVTPVGYCCPWRILPSSTSLSLGSRCSEEAQLRLFAARQGPVPDLLWSCLSRQEASWALLKSGRSRNQHSGMAGAKQPILSAFRTCVITLHETPLFGLGQGNYFHWI